MLQTILQDLKPKQVTLVAVSKTKPQAKILELYDQGQRIFGENRVQELVEKYEAMPKDIEWHMIGHLQKNKVKYIAPFVSLIHSVDSNKLLETIDKEAHKNQRIIPVLIQMKIATEESKFGASEQEMIRLIEQAKQCDHVQVHGMMGMASFVGDQDQIQSEFELLKNTFDKVKDMYFTNDPYFKEISMGMSGDYKLAILSGSTMVRIGSLLFGSR